jgi:hypothetical protein
LDRWGIDNPDTIVDEVPLSLEQENQLSRVLRAVTQATAITEIDDARPRSAYVPSGDELLEPPSQGFELDR